MPPRESSELGGVVLTGGRSVRLEGADKATMEVGGRTLLEHVLGALAEVPDVVVVGDEVPTSRPVTWRREEPAGSGPAAALLAGLDGFPALPRLVAVLAVDLPLVTTATIRRLMLSADQDGALLVDDAGRDQYLCAVYRTRALMDAAPGPAERDGLPVRRLVEPLVLARVEALPWEARDVDTWEDLRELRDRLG